MHRLYLLLDSKDNILDLIVELREQYCIDEQHAPYLHLLQSPVIHAHTTENQQSLESE